MKQGREMTPLHTSIYYLLKEVHIIWVTSPQVYDICDLHQVPQYSISYEKTLELMEKLETIEHISIVEYYTDRNYVSTSDHIRVTNIFEDGQLFNESELDTIFETIDNP